jgi:translation initiation factor 3 subunit B
MPVDDASKQTKGYAFIEFASAAEAAAAQEQTDGYKLDKQHVFKARALAWRTRRAAPRSPQPHARSRAACAPACAAATLNPREAALTRFPCHPSRLQVSLLDDFARYAAVPDAYAPPEAKPFAPREDLMSWLLDPRGRDQFAARFADETELYWNDAHSKRPEEVYRRSYWTESYVQWSPRGNYITTVHRQGIALWGGPTFARLARMQHPGIQFLEYSPGERYIATCSVTEPSNPRESVSVTVAFFDVRSGRKLRAFTGGIEDFLLPGAAGAGGGRSVRGWLLRGCPAGGASVVRCASLTRLLAPAAPAPACACAGLHLARVQVGGRRGRQVLRQDWQKRSQHLRGAWRDPPGA